MFDCLSVNNIIFTIPVVNYPMSFIEFVGTLFNLWSVILATKNKVSNFSVGIIGCIFFIIIFYQVCLYSDMILNIIFTFISIYGLYRWNHPKTSLEISMNKDLKIRRSSLKGIMIYSSIILVGSVLMGWFMSNIHLFLPKLFPNPASFPYLDSLVAVSSTVAITLMSKRLYDCWYLWFGIDVICVWLYYTKGIMFISLLYFVFIITAIMGLVSWWKTMKIENNIVEDNPYL